MAGKSLEQVAIALHSRWSAYSCLGGMARPALRWGVQQRQPHLPTPNVTGQVGPIPNFPPDSRAPGRSRTPSRNSMAEGCITPKGA